MALQTFTLEAFYFKEAVKDKLAPEGRHSHPLVSILPPFLPFPSPLSCSY